MAALGRLFLLSLLCLGVSSEEGEEEELDEVNLLQVKAAVQPREGSVLQGNASRDVLYHLHIPKAAGISFMNDALNAIRPHGLKLWSQEGCLALGKSGPRVRAAVLLLRKPREHVLSQFDFCFGDIAGAYVEAVRRPWEPRLPRSFEAWLRQWKALRDSGWHGDFTPPSVPVQPQALTFVLDRFPDWSHPPWSPEPTMHNFIADWQLADGGGTCWHFTGVPGNCYVPISMQAQRLTCQMPLNYTVLPDADLAIRNMQGTWFVGLVEAYQASQCLLHVKLGEPLPSYCNCKSPQSWNSFPGSHDNHNGKGQKLSDFSPEVLRLADDLTQADRKLYDAARVRFVAEIRQVEQRFATTILCNESTLVLP